MGDTIYTIGYSGFKIDDFVKTLKDNGISVVIDVRSLPYSQFHPDYNKEHLAKVLESAKIYYRSYAAEFGARQENRKYYPNGYLDFELFAQSEAFLSGYEKIKRSMEKGFVIALMCSEKEPIECHRALLVARAFHDAGYTVLHLLPDDEPITQDDLVIELFTGKKPIKGQISAFPPSKECIDKAYKKQNEKIGYNIEGDN